MVRGERIEFAVPERFNLGSYYLDVNLEAGRGDKTAVYYKDRTYSFRDLWKLTNKVGNVLRELGVEPENRVLLILEDSPEWAAAWLGAMKVGAVGAHAYTYLHAKDYAYLFDLVRPKIVVADRVTLDRVRQAGAETRYPKAFLVAGEDVQDRLREREFSLSRMLECADDRLEIEPTHRDDIAFWNFSSGTTGKPKGVPHRHYDGAVAYESFNRVLGYGESDIVLRVPKLFFHYARDVGFLSALRSGAASVLFEEKATAPLVFDLVRRYRPTVLINVPTMMRAMLQTPEHARADLSCVRRTMSSGEPLSAQLYHEWVGAFGGEVVNRFGSAESAMGYLCNRPGAVAPGSSGAAAPLAEIKLVDPEGAEVPQGQPGLMMVRCAAAGTHYVREHEKSKETFPGDQWVNTGDLFRQDENDCFWYVGRADDLVKVSGVWISPLEVERSLQEFPAVKECAALGIKNDDGLIRIKAFVVLRDGAAACAGMDEELKRFCKGRLGPHKFPGAIEFMDELPKTGQGKIDRRALRERGFEAG